MRITHTLLATEWEYKSMTETHFGEYRHHTLQEGTFISNEPGLYGDFSITLNGVHYEESIGIRIEDTLRIEKNHATNFSTAIPKAF